MTREVRTATVESTSESLERATPVPDEALEELLEDDEESQ